MQPFSSPKGGSWSKAFHVRLRKLGMRIRQLALSMLWPNALAIRNSSEIMLCFVKNVLRRFMFSTLMSQTNAHSVRGRATVNDVERFRNGSLIHEFHSCKTSQNMCKVHTSSHEVTNVPYVRTNDENTTTTVTADLTINYDVEKNTSLAEKIKNVGEYNFESGANNCELDIKRH